MKEISYQELENYLIAQAEQWISSGKHQKGFHGYDNTPFIQIEEGVKARAEKPHDYWRFKVIMRQGWSGTPFPTFKEAYEDTLREKKEYFEKLNEEIKKMKG